MTVLPRIAKNPKPAHIQYVSQYVQQIRSITGRYLSYIPEYYADVPSAENYYNIIENDEVIYSEMEGMALATAGESWSVKQKDPIIKELLILSLREIRDFCHAKKSLVHKGLLYGLAVQRKIYEEVEFDEFPGLTWVIPTRLEEVDRRRLRIERDHNDKTKQYWTVYMDKFDKYIVLEDRAESPLIMDGCGVQDYIWWFGEHEEQFPYGFGIGNVLYPMAYLRSKCKQYWADLAESWSKPTWLWFIDVANASFNASSNLGVGHNDVSSRVANLLDVAESMRGRHSGVFDKDERLEIHESGSTGNNIISEFLEYIDKKIKTVICGADVENNAGGGSYAKASVLQQKEDKKVVYFRKRLEEKLRRDLMWDILYRNRFNLLRLGKRLPRASSIGFEISSTREDMKENVLNNAGERNIGQLAKQI